MSNERIIEKVKKLLALAQDPSAAPNEAETAGRQAAALMAKYSLDLAELTEAELKAEWDLTDMSIPGVRPGKKNAREVPPWIGFMAFGVKTYTRTRCSSRGPMLHFKGPRQDVELAHWMLKALIDLAYTASKGNPSPNAFRNGFAAAVQKRLKVLATQRDSADQEVGSRALVVVDKLKAAMDEQFGPEGKTSTSNARMSAAGHQAGMAATLPTARPISQSTGRLLT